MVHSDTCKIFLTWADIAVIAWYGVVGQLLIKQLPPFSESFSSSGKLALFNKAVGRIKWYPEHHLMPMWPNDTEIVWGSVDTWWCHEKVRTQDHMRWCGCKHDGISEKVRTQDTAHEVVWIHAWWYQWEDQNIGHNTWGGVDACLMTSAGRLGHRTTSRISARVYWVEIGIVFTLAKFGEEAGSLVKLRWLNVIQIADLMKRTWCILLKPCVCLHSQGSL